MEEKRGRDAGTMHASACEDSAEDRSEHAVLAGRAQKSMPDERAIEQMCGAFKAIGEPSRMKIILALRQGEMCVYHIAAAVGGNQSNVSHQLRILKDSRIVRARRDGKNVLYSLADEHIAVMVSMSLAHLRCEEAGI